MFQVGCSRIPEDTPNICHLAPMQALRVRCGHEDVGSAAYIGRLSDVPSRVALVEETERRFTL
jgi:hypothetical protein